MNFPGQSAPIRATLALAVWAERGAHTKSVAAVLRNQTLRVDSGQLGQADAQGLDEGRKVATKKSTRSKNAAPKKKVTKKQATRKVARKATKKVPRKATKKVAKKKATKKVAKKTATKKVAKKKATKKVAKKTASGPVDAAVGTKAPAFELGDQAGREVTSAFVAGKAYVLYFYPKDDTPGCTREACGFTDEFPNFESLGMQVFGVSPDTESSHARFADKYKLGITLLSDPDKELAQAYGVWILKKNYGREYMGIARSTFLVDAGGVIRQVWRNVKVNGHVEAVLEAARNL